MRASEMCRAMLHTTPVDRLKRRDFYQILVPEQHFLSLMIGPLDRIQVFSSPVPSCL